MTGCRQNIVSLKKSHGFASATGDFQLFGGRPPPVNPLSRVWPFRHGGNIDSESERAQNLANEFWLANSNRD